MSGDKGTSPANLLLLSPRKKEVWKKINRTANFVQKKRGDYVPSTGSFSTNISVDWRKKAYCACANTWDKIFSCALTKEPQFRPVDATFSFSRVSQGGFHGGSHRYYQRYV